MIDLHTHSSASDGTDSPGELVRKAASLGISVLALTDHDNIDGLADAAKTAAESGVKFVRGCEISTTSELGGVHILGLWLPEKSPSLDSFLDDMRAARRERNERLLAKLDSLGYPIADEFPGDKGSLGRAHFADALVRKGYAGTFSDAFDNLIGAGGAAYVPHVTPDPEEAVKILAEIGATPVFAHPLLKPWSIASVATLTKRLQQNGLAGVEVWHSSHSPEAVRALTSLAGELGLAVSGGSDYHGLKKPKIRLGVGAGDAPIPAKALDSLLAARRARGLPVPGFEE